MIRVLVIINPIHFGTIQRSPEVTRGQIWSVIINFVPRYHSTAFAFLIWPMIFHWVIKVLVTTILIHLGTFWRSPEVTKGQNWPYFINFEPRYCSTAFANHIWFPIFYLVMKVFVTMNPIYFVMFLEVTRGHQM